MGITLIYPRVSTDDQARHGYSLEDQIAECEKKAKELGATTIINCGDEGVSGEVLERPGLSRARELIRNGGVSYFICYDPDRLARKLSHQLIITEEIERYGCKLIFINFDWQNTPEGRLFYSLRGAIAEFEREKIRERTMRGLRRKAEQGGITHDPDAYGYSYNPKTNNLEIVPEEADVYRMMSEWFLKGELGYSRQATKLTEMGIPTKRGAESWSATTVSRMLVNPLYKGEFWIQRYNTVGVRNNKYKKKSERIIRSERPRDEWCLIEVPAIIDEVTYQAHLRQAARISRIFKKRTFHGDYLLSGMLRCGLCGATMNGSRSRKNKYYRCRAKASDSTLCDQRHFRAAKLELPVWKTAASWLEEPKALFEAISSQIRHPGKDIDLKVVKRQLKQIAEERSRLIDLVQKGLTSVEEVAERLAELKERSEKLNASLAEHKINQLTLPPTNLDIHNIESALRILHSQVKVMDFSGRQRIIRELMDEIIVLPDEIIINARIP